MGCLHSHENNHRSTGLRGEDDCHIHAEALNPCHHENVQLEITPPPVSAPLSSPSQSNGIREIIENKIRRKSKIMFGEDNAAADNVSKSLSPTAVSSGLSKPNTSLQCRPEDFIIHNFLAKGGMGAVYCGVRKIDSLKIALKFFGYDEKCPDVDAIQQEVTALTALRGLDGVVSLIGIFSDTPNGILGKKAYKIWPKSYPVLVMPLLEGGALIDRIHVRTSVCENDLKHWFKEFIIGLGNIHLKGYIHRDLKLENIMLESMADDSPVCPCPTALLTSPAGANH